METAIAFRGNEDALPDELHCIARRYTHPRAPPVGRRVLEGRRPNLLRRNNVP